MSTLSHFQKQLLLSHFTDAHDILLTKKDYEFIEAVFEQEKPKAKDRAATLAAENKRLNKELEIVHQCLTDLYNDGENRIGDRVKQCLNEIEKLPKLP